MTWFLSALAFLKKAPAWAYAALGVVLAIGWAFLRGKSQGRSSANQKANDEAMERREKTDKIEREIEGLPDDELEKRGRPWVR